MCIVLLIFKNKWKRNVFAAKRKRDGDELAQITAENRPPCGIDDETNRSKQ